MVVSPVSFNFVSCLLFFPILCKIKVSANSKVIVWRTVVSNYQENLTQKTKTKKSPHPHIKNRWIQLLVATQSVGWTQASQKCLNIIKSTEERQQQVVNLRKRVSTSGLRRNDHPTSYGARCLGPKAVDYTGVQKPRGVTGFFLCFDGTLFGLFVFHEFWLRSGQKIWDQASCLVKNHQLSFFLTDIYG